LVKQALVALTLGVIPSPGRPAAPEFRHGAGSYEAGLSGTMTGTLSGTVDLGPARSDRQGAPVVIALGAYSDAGAIVFTLWNGSMPRPGTYEISADPNGVDIGALVLTGSATHPTGAFRGERGTVTITSSSDAGVFGAFEIHAHGFLASETERDDRELVARGWFAAAPRH
jgi:hypothetical protein